jgi:hypothetical protein
LKRSLALAALCLVFAGVLAQAGAEVRQQGAVRITIDGRLSPRRLPRQEAAPIAVSVGWKLATLDASPPPKLKTLKIELNRAGHIDLTGLPTCPLGKIQPASTARALAGCRSALVGSGRFQALIALAGQESYVTKGRMLVFNAKKGGQPVLFGQIYSARPFTNSFVIAFRLRGIAKGRFGTELSATLPASLRAWGSLTEIQMRLKRSFDYKGRRRSFLSAACPAPKGFPGAAFPLARTTFSFEAGLTLTSTLNRSCKVRSG